MLTDELAGDISLNLEDNLDAIGVSLDENEHERLDAVAPPGRATVPYYDADFGPHEFRW